MSESKRVYIAAKLGEAEWEVKILMEELESRGYVIIYDWTENPVPKPFQDNADEADEVAEVMAHAVMNCDIMIVLYSVKGVGLLIETGGALVAGIIMGFIKGQTAKDIYLVGKGNERSVFFFHRSVTRVPDIEALLTFLPAVTV